MDVIKKLRSTEYDDIDACKAADELEVLRAEVARLRHHVAAALDAVTLARGHFLAGSKEGGFSLCAMRLAMDILDEAVGEVPNVVLSTNLNGGTNGTD